MAVNGQIGSVPYFAVTMPTHLYSSDTTYKIAPPSRYFISVPKEMGLLTGVTVKTALPLLRVGLMQVT